MREMVAKPFEWVLTAVFAVLLVACGGDESDSDESDASRPPLTYREAYIRRKLVDQTGELPEFRYSVKLPEGMEESEPYSSFHSYRDTGKQSGRRLPYVNVREADGPVSNLDQAQSLQEARGEIKNHQQLEDGFYALFENRDDDWVAYSATCWRTLPNQESAECEMEWYTKVGSLSDEAFAFMKTVVTSFKTAAEDYGKAFIERRLIDQEATLSSYSYSIKIPEGMKETDWDPSDEELPVSHTYKDPESEELAHVNLPTISIGPEWPAVSNLEQAQSKQEYYGKIKSHKRLEDGFYAFYVKEHEEHWRGGDWVTHRAVRWQTLSNGLTVECSAIWDARSGAIPADAEATMKRVVMSIAAKPTPK